ncbi:reverse transcriptase domain-containing protein [Tanacetum coccineum]
MRTRSQTRNRPQQQVPPNIEPFNLEEPLENQAPPVVTMVDQRTMAEFLHAPTEGYAEAIVVPPILAEHFELKHSLINMMTSDQFFGLEKDNPHDHIRWFNKITSTIKYKDVPNSAIKLMLFPFSLARAACRWLEKEPPCSILTWEDLVSKFINEFFPPSRTTNLRNEISNFEQCFGESFHKAWDRYKDLLRACPHHGFTELHQLDTFYNALNPTDQDSLNSAAGGNLLERSTRDVLTIIENKSKVRNSRNKSIVSQVKSSDVNSSSSSDIAKLTHAVNQQTSVVTTAMTAILKQFQATPPPASVKAVEEICVTCGGAHPYYQCVVNQTRPPGFAQPNGQNNQNRFSQPQGYNRGNNFNQNTTYQAPTQQNQVVPLSELEKIKKMNDVNIKAMQAQINNVKNELRNEMQTSIQASMSNQTNELKNMMGIFFQMNTASTSCTGSLPSNTIANPKGELKAITTRSGLVLDGPSVPMPPPFINPEEDKRVEEILTDPEHGEFTIKEICTPVGIARDVFVLVGKFIFPVDFIIVDYESDPRVPLILGRPFLRTARALIDIHGEEMILRDGDERLTLNMRHDTSSYSNNPQKESINMIDIYNISHEEYLEDLLANEKITNHSSGNPTSSLTSHTDLTSPKVNDDIFDPEGDIIKNLLNLDKTKDLPPYHDNPLSGIPTLISETMAKSSSSLTLTSFEESDLIWEEFEAYLASDSFPPGNDDPVDLLLKEFTDELALITFPLGNDDLPFDIESDLQEIEYLLNHDPIEEMDSILKDSVDKNSPDDNLVDTISKMFTDEHALDYSSPPLWDDYDDELFDLKTVNDNTYYDPFDSKEDKIKDSKILIDELDPPRSSDFLPFLECDSVFYEDFYDVDALPSTNNEDKDFNPPLYELPFHKEVPGSETLLSFSSENEEKFSTLGFSFLKEFILLFSRNYLIGALKLSKSLKILKARWIARIFEASRALGFCPSFTRASNPQLHFGNPISKSYRLTFIFKHT